MSNGAGIEPNLNSETKEEPLVFESESYGTEIVLVLFIVAIGLYEWFKRKK